jgi:hypothetical protein
MTRRGLFGFAAIAAVVLAVGVGSWSRLPHGGLPTLSFDSFRYLAGAYSLRDHGAYRDIDGTPQRVWPPATSALYGALSAATRSAPEELPGAVGLTSYLIAMAALALLIGHTIRRVPVAALTFAAVAWNTFIISMTNKLWSDLPALACLCVVLALLAIRPPSPASIGFAALVVAIGVSFRYAMIAAIALPLWAAWRIRTRTIVIAVFAAAAVLLVALASRLTSAHSIQVADDMRALATLAGQILPAGYGGTFIVASALAISIFLARRAVPAAIVWIGAYPLFLCVAQAIAEPSFAFDLRILIPLYPAVAVVIGSAADALFENRKAAGGFALATVLLIASGRALHGLAASPAPPPACLSRETIVTLLQRLSLDGARISSNAQGLAWYALRRPVSATPRPGDTFILIRASAVCPDIVESPAVAPLHTRVVEVPQ